MTHLGPGLVDIHGHGALGAEFGRSESGSRLAAAHHRREGTTQLVASLVSAAPAELADRVAVLAPLVADRTLAGIHLEGPFLADRRRGAHDPAALRPPDPGLVARLADVCDQAGAPGALRQWTFAPELDGAPELIRAMAARGILPAVGHTDATADEMTRALSMIADATGRTPLVTHLFNGMPPWHHRAGGAAVGALAAACRGEAVVELIADGTHVAAEVVRMVFDAVGPDGIALVSDAMSATGLGDGAYRIGELEVSVTAGVARLAGDGAIAGSTTTLAGCLRWATEVAGIPEVDALRAATRTPRLVLGISPAPEAARISAD